MKQVSREEAAARNRALIEAADPTLAAMIADSKEVFGARVSYLRVGEVELGRRAEFEEQGVVPQSPQRLSVGDLKEAERRHIAEALEARDRACGGSYRGRRPRVGRGA